MVTRSRVTSMGLVMVWTELVWTELVWTVIMVWTVMVRALVVSIVLGSALVWASLCSGPVLAADPPPLPDLLGDDPTDGTAAGFSSPLPPRSEPSSSQLQKFEQQRNDAEQLKKPLAAEELAEAYIQGNLLERDLKQAVKYLKLAIENGSATAPNKLGVLLATGGPGLLRDPIEAVKRLQQGATVNDPKAIYNLAQQYRTGELLERDEKKAFELFGQAASLNLADAQTNVGIMMMEGLGTRKDEAGAVKVWREAARADNPRAYYFLGLAYAHGKGVARNLDEARTWLQKARDRNFTPAAAALDALDRR